MISGYEIGIVCYTIVKEKIPNFDKVAVKKEVMRAKLHQHTDVREMLKQTDNNTILKNHPDDYVWRTEADRSGGNVREKILIELRNELLLQKYI